MEVNLRGLEAVKLSKTKKSPWTSLTYVPYAVPAFPRSSFPSPRATGGCGEVPPLPSLFPCTVYILLGRFFLISAVILAFLTIFLTVSSASELFPRTWKHNVVSATVSFLTGICAFLAMLLHALEIRDLRMKPSPPQFSMQWPYYILGFDILLFLVAGAICLSQGKICLRCRLLPIYQSTEDVQGTLHLEKLESLGGKLSWVQKETQLREATVI
ncbi:transmembrane protein 225B isoform X3 [Ictidomys tridecemlineatus]